MLFGEYDVIVIGAGHAGIEAALAAARLGCKTAVFTMNLDSVANLPCNPSIGGTAKGHLVCEIDALGGEMGRAADASTLQSRMLNRGKGPAVHSLRAQVDRRRYSEYMKSALESQSGLELKQAQIVSLDKTGGGWEVTTHLGAKYAAKKVIISTGTYLSGKIFVGSASFESGPDFMFAAKELSASLIKLGLPLRRFKTGTPARVHSRSIDYSVLEKQYGDEPPEPFSKDTAEPLINKVVCHVTWTNERTKEVIMQNLHRSAMYSGKIEGKGPRYCPSLEDKMVRFADKERHQIFIEPCGFNTQEMYLQGASSSMPEDVQRDFYRTIKGLEHVEIMRPAYAIEYDCVDPLAMNATLEFKDWPGLYGAGQFNGSSGYEEAAAQGIVAGINAALSVKGREQLVLGRQTSYIGTLIDDLVTKGCSDPYRMMTSRSEYRLLLRQDNAEERLTPIGREIGLIPDKRWAAFLNRQELKRAEISRLKRTTLPPSDALNEILVSRETSPVSSGVKITELLRRPQISYSDLDKVDAGRPKLPPDIRHAVETEIKYEGYIEKQLARVAELKRLESRMLPDDIDYESITGIRLEAKEKLAKHRPKNLGQASRISGVSTADISVLLIYLQKRDGEAERADRA